MNETTLKVIEAMAIKLGTTADALWGVLMTQAKVQAITYLCIVVVLWLLTAAAGVMFFVRSKRGRKEHGDYYSSDDAQVAIAITGFCLAFVALVTSLICATSIVNGFINPAFEAIKFIASAV